MNTINLTQELLNRNGSIQISKIPTKEMVAGENGEMHEETRMVDTNVTLGALLIHACLKENMDKEETSILDRYNLFLKLDNNETVELVDEEMSILKKLVAETYDTFNSGAILTILNNL